MITTATNATIQATGAHIPYPVNSGAIGSISGTSQYCSNIPGLVRKGVCSRGNNTVNYRLWEQPEEDNNYSQDTHTNQHRKGSFLDICILGKYRAHEY